MLQQESSEESSKLTTDSESGDDKLEQSKQNGERHRNQSKVRQNRNLAMLSRPNRLWNCGLVLLATAMFGELAKADEEFVESFGDDPRVEFFDAFFARGFADLGSTASVGARVNSSPM